jgi:sugar phosphate isomerase/epimerase
MYKSINPGVVNLRELKFKDLLPVASANRFGAVDYSPVAIEEELGVEHALDLMGQYGVIISNCNFPVVVGREQKDYDESFPKLEKFARLARSLGIKRNVMVLSPASNALDFAENFKLTVKRLRTCCEILNDYEISLGLEFIGPRGFLSRFKYIFINTIEGTLELCDAVGTGNIGLILDAHHLYTSGVPGDGYLKSIRSQKDIVVAHLNDDEKGVPYNELGDNPRYLPGEEGGGGNDVQAFMNGLKTIGYTGPVIAEPFSKKLAELTDANEIAKIVSDSIDSVWPK